MRDYLCEDGVKCAGIITYTEDLYIQIKAIETPLWEGYSEERIGITNEGYKKLFLEQQLEVARLGAMRVIGLKEKINLMK